MVTIFFLPLLTVCYTVLVPALDNHVSDEQLMSIRNLKYINYMCFEAHQAFNKPHAVFDQGRAFERGEGEGLCHPFDGLFLTYMYRHIHHILTFHTSGYTWPAAFYLLIRISFDLVFYTLYIYNI